MRHALKALLTEISSNKQLKDCSYENTSTYSLMGTKCKGKVLKVYDGDTLWIALPIPENTVYKYKARLYGYNSPELKHQGSAIENAESKENIELAIQAKKRLQDLVCDGSILDVELLNYDKYGRILIKIFKDGNCVNDQMVKEGYGKPYFGGHKED